MSETTQQPAVPQKPAIRQLFLTAVFTIFLALVVFVVGASAFLLPLFAAQELRLASLESQIVELRDALDEATAVPEEEPVAEAPAAPTDAAPAAPTAEAAAAP